MENIENIKNVMDVIKLHETKESFGFTYSTNSNILELSKQHEDLIYFLCPKTHKRYYFKEKITDYSNVRDCDIRYEYIPVNVEVVAKEVPIIT
jgi:hypothetical protein